MYVSYCTYWDLEITSIIMVNRTDRSQVRSRPLQRVGQSVWITFKLCFKGLESSLETTTCYSTRRRNYGREWGACHEWRMGEDLLLHFGRRTNGLIEWEGLWWYNRVKRSNQSYLFVNFLAFFYWINSRMNVPTISHRFWICISLCIINLSDNHAAYIYIPVPYLKLKLHFNQRKLNQPDTTPAQLQHADWSDSN